MVWAHRMGIAWEVPPGLKATQLMPGHFALLLYAGRELWAVRKVQPSFVKPVVFGVRSGLCSTDLEVLLCSKCCKTGFLLGGQRYSMRELGVGCVRVEILEKSVSLLVLKTAGVRGSWTEAGIRKASWEEVYELYGAVRSLMGGGAVGEDF